MPDAITERMAYFVMLLEAKTGQKPTQTIIEGVKSLLVSDAASAGESLVQLSKEERLFISDRVLSEVIDAGKTLVKNAPDLFERETAKMQHQLAHSVGYVQEATKGIERAKS